MKTTETFARTVAAVMQGLVGCLVLLLVAGCGLTMDNEDRLDRAEHMLAAGDTRAAMIDAKNVLLDEPDNLRGRLILGHASLLAGDGPSAEKELNRAIQLGADPADVAGGLARALLLQGDYQEVIDSISFDSLPSREEEVVVRRAHGDAYLGLGDTVSARTMFTTVLDRKPDDLEALIGIASSYMAEGNFAEAGGVIEHALDTNRESPRTWLFSGEFNARIREFDAAIGNFDHALRLAESTGDTISQADALVGLVDVQLDRGDESAARTNLEVLTKLAPDRLQTVMLNARMAYTDEDWVTAQQRLQQVLGAAPQYMPAQVLLGAVHLQRGNLAHAEMYLSSAVASVPNDAQARQLLAATQLQMQKSREVQETLAPIIGGTNADSLSLRMAASASLAQNDPDEAVKFLRRIVDDNPNDADLRFQLAATMLQLGRTHDAQVLLDAMDVSGSEEDEYRRDAMSVLTALRDGQAGVALRLAHSLAATYKTQPGAIGVLGTVQLANNDVDEARASFERLLELKPSSLMARRYLASIAESTGDYAAAAAQYADIIDAEPRAAWAVFALGLLRFRSEDYSAAEEQFRRAAELEPRNPIYRQNLARAKANLGKETEAEAVLEEDLELTLDHPRSAALLAMLKARRGDGQGAFELVAALQERFPDNPVPYALEGEIHMVGGDLTAADAAYTKAAARGTLKPHAIRAYQIKRDLGRGGAHEPLTTYLEARPLDTEVQAVLGEAYLTSGKPQQSIAAYERVLAAQPNNPVYLNNLAWAYFEVGDERAIQTARKAHDLMPENGAILDTLGWILYQGGEVERAVELLRQAVEQSPTNPEIRYHLAAALSESGRGAEARSIVDELLESGTAFPSRSEAEQLASTL